MKFLALTLACHLLTTSTATPLSSTSSSPPQSTSTCRKTKVAILGAGVAGITAAQTLHNASISDFLVIDVNDYIGGRLHNTKFGKNPTTGEPYTIELGANWVQGLGGGDNPENPIWRLAKKWGLKNTYSDFESLRTFNDEGEMEIEDELYEEYSKAYEAVERDAGELLVQDLQDRMFRTQFRINGWKPRPVLDSVRQAIEWFNFDFEYAYPPEESSTIFTIVNDNSSFKQYSPENNLVTDQRGFSHFLVSEASTFLEPNDPRLLLSTNVTSIDYSSASSVTIHTSNNTCIEASHAIVTFSLGVLQNDIVNFVPALPSYKKEAIQSMQMGTYTKIFMQFPPSADGTFFFDRQLNGTQYYLYADPEERGYYPIFQSLSAPDFLPGSGILFGTLVSQQSYVVEAQDANKTKNEMLEILGKMFGAENVPEPLDFTYPRWSQEDWTRGSYSNWPPGLSLEMHQNLRSDLGDGRVWFAGEASSVEFFGFLHGAYDEGYLAGMQLAECIKKGMKKCKARPKYKTLKGCTTSPRMLTAQNGWFGRSFDT